MHSPDLSGPDACEVCVVGVKTDSNESRCQQRRPSGQVFVALVADGLLELCGLLETDFPMFHTKQTSRLKREWQSSPLSLPRQAANLLCQLRGLRASVNSACEFPWTKCFVDCFRISSAEIIGCHFLLVKLTGIAGS